MDQELNSRLTRVFHTLIRAMESLWEGFQRPSLEWGRGLVGIRNALRDDSGELTRSMISKRATLEQKEWVKPYFSILSSLDLIGYNLDGLFDRIQKMLQEKILFTDRGLNEINQIFQETVQLLENMPDFLLTGNRLLAQQLQEKGKRIFRLADEFGEEHESRLIEGLCMPKASPIYLGLLESLKGIAFHSLEITEKMVSSSAKA